MATPHKHWIKQAIARGFSVGERDTDHGNRNMVTVMFAEPGRSRPQVHVTYMDDPEGRSRIASVDVSDDPRIHRTLAPLRALLDRHPVIHSGDSETERPVYADTGKPASFVRHYPRELF